MTVFVTDEKLPYVYDIHTYIYIYIYAFVFVLVCFIFGCLLFRVDSSVYMYILYMYIYIYVYVCVYMSNIYIYIYICGLFLTRQENESNNDMLLVPDVGFFHELTCHLESSSRANPSTACVGSWSLMTARSQNGVCLTLRKYPFVGSCFFVEVGCRAAQIWSDLHSSAKIYRDPRRSAQS